MRVALCQLAATTDLAANREAVRGAVARAVRSAPDLVVLPEATMHDFGPPGTDLGAVAEPLDGPFVTMLAEQARTYGTTVVAGMFERTAEARSSAEPATGTAEARSSPEAATGTAEARSSAEAATGTAAAEDGLPANTVVVVGPDGALRASYRKVHLYDAFGHRESERLAPGEPVAVTADVGGTRIGLMTCYDLRFPELARALVDAGAEVIVVPSAWVRGPLKERHWEVLLAARAIESTVWVAAAAQNGPAYCGRSMLVDPLGVAVAALGEQDGVVVGEVDPDRLADVRRRNPSLQHRRFRVVPREP